VTNIPSPGDLDGICREALSVFGKENQLRQTQEECGELIAAINQYLRKDRRGTSVIDEVADVWIMLTQLKMAFSAEDFLDAIERKLPRLQEHVAREKSLKIQLSLHHPAL